MSGSSFRSRPLITVKWAQTLDGRLATSTRHSRWISGPETRALAHRLRAEHDAILVGVGTVEADNPELTTRLVPGPNPLPIILDGTLRIPPNAALVRPGTLIATLLTAPAERERMLVARGVEIVRVPAACHRVDLVSLMSMLPGRGIRSVLVEGGASVITSFLRLRLADEILIVLAPRVSGAGVDAVGDLGVKVLDRSIGFEQASFVPMGDDVVFRGRPVWAV